MKKIILFTVILFSTSFFGQPGTIDPSFNSGDIGYWNGNLANNSIYTTSIQSDGKIIIGGEFNNYNQFDRNRITRLNTDGSIDTSFNASGANNTIYSTSIQSDGKIIIGGNFTYYTGVGTYANRIARLNVDGSTDVTFNPGMESSLGANNNVRTTSILSNGKIIIGGDFTTYNGIASNRIACLDTSGNLDTSFNVGTGANNKVLTTSIQSDGKIIICGYFTTYNGIARNHIARLNTDGTLDTSFNPGTGANSGSYIQTSYIQSDGKIIIGGSFTSYNGIARNRIARLNTDGTIDTTFNPGTGANNTVNTTSIQNDGKIIIGGDFTSYNGTVCNRIIRINTNGTLDTNFNPGTGANNTVFSTSIQNDGKIIVGGNFTFYDATSRNRITRITLNGSIDTSFCPGTGANDQVLTTSIQSDGKIIIGGSFTSYNGINLYGITRLNTDGTIDTTFNSGTGLNSGTDIGRYIQTTKIQSDGKIIIGGDFISYNGIARNHIARLNTDGTLDTSFNPGTGANIRVVDTSIQSDGKIIIGGYFTSYNGTARNQIARLNIDGTLDTTFNPGTGANNAITTTSIQSDGKIIIGGDFTSYNGTVINRIARLNTIGTLDTTFNPGIGANNTVKTTSIQSDGKIIIGGDFTSYSGNVRNRIVRINVNGSIDTTFNAGVATNASGTVQATTIQSDGKIIIGGDFLGYGNQARYKLARLNNDGTNDATFNPLAQNFPIPGGNNSVRSISIQSDGKIIIGGVFTAYNMTGRNRIARINGGAALFNPSFDLSTTVIYPNPSNGYFNVKIDDLIGTKNIEVYSVLGQKIYSKSIVENESSIDLSNQPKGIYFYKISDNNIVIKSGKLIIE